MDARAARPVVRFSMAERTSTAERLNESSRVTQLGVLPAAVLPPLLS